METQKARLTEGPVGQHLVAMTVPVLLGIMTLMGQALIDAWFLGRVSDRALAAHAFSFPILMIVTSVAIGLGAGTSSVVARAIGAGDHRRARRLATDSLLLSFILTAVVSIVGVATIEPLFRVLGAPDDMIPLIRGFMIILYSGVPFVVVGMVGMASMRATGDTRLPSKLMILGAFINVALDPILIFGFIRCDHNCVITFSAGAVVIKNRQLQFEIEQHAIFRSGINMLDHLGGSARDSHHVAHWRGRIGRAVIRSAACNGQC